MNHLTEAQLAELRAAIEERLFGLRQEIDASATLRSGLDRRGDLQDRAADEAERGNVMARSRSARREVAELEAALARMAAGTYGVCEETDERIPYARLRLTPTARYITSVQQELETEAQRTREPADDGEPY